MHLEFLEKLFKLISETIIFVWPLFLLGIGVIFYVERVAKNSFLLSLNEKYLQR